MAEKNGISVYELNSELAGINLDDENNENSYAPNFKDFKKTINDIADGFIKLK